MSSHLSSNWFINMLFYAVEWERQACTEKLIETFEFSWHVQTLEYEFKIHDSVSIKFPLNCAKLATFANKGLHREEQNKFTKEIGDRIQDFLVFILMPC